jgi:hypothetical protein
MTEEEMMEGPLPEWAIDRTDGTLYNGVQLPTRDGRRCGNAHVIGFSANYKTTGLNVYHVLTDAGTVMRLTEGEVTELFYPPKWVSRVPDVIRKFRPGDNRISSEVFLAVEQLLNLLPNQALEVFDFKDTYELASALSREKKMPR